MSENTPDINPETVPSPIQPPAKTLLQGISQAYDASRAFFTPAGQIPGMVQKMKASFMTRTSLEYNSRIAQMQGLKKLVSEKFTKKEKIEDNQQQEQSIISSTIEKQDEISTEQKEKQNQVDIQKGNKEIQQKEQINEESKSNNIQTDEQQTQHIKSQHLTYGLSAKDPFQRVKVNGQDTLFNRLHIERKRIENPFEILSNIILGLKFLQLIEDERQYNGIKEQSQNVNTKLIPNNSSPQNTNKLKNQSQTQQQSQSLNESLSNVAHPLFGDFSSYRIMFDNNDSPVIFLGNISGFDQNKYVWQEIERRMKDIEMKQLLKQNQSMIGQLKSQFQSISDNVGGQLKSISDNVGGQLKSQFQSISDNVSGNIGQLKSQFQSISDNVSGNLVNQFKWIKNSFKMNSQQQQPSTPLSSQLQSESIEQPIPDTIPTQSQTLLSQQSNTDSQSSLQGIDDIDWRFNELDFDIDSSYGGGYEYIRWRSPEYLGLNEKWEELINNNNNNNQLSNSIDQIVNPIESNLVFSIGMVLYEIITVEIPFGEFDAISASKQLVKGKRPSLSEFNQTVIGDLIESCWQQDPKQRISLNDLYDIIMSISKIWNIDQQQSQSSTDTNQNESNQISPSLKQSNESLLKQLAKYISPRQYKKISLLKSQSGTLKRKQSGIKGQQSNSTLKRKNNNNNQNNVKESTKLVNSELNDHNDDKNDQNEDKEAQQAQEDPLQDTQEQNEEEGEEELGEIKKDDEDIFVDEIDYFKRLSDEEEDDYNDNQDNED